MGLSQNWLFPREGGNQLWSVSGIMRWIRGALHIQTHIVTEEKHVTFLTSQLQTPGHSHAHLCLSLILTLVYHLLAEWP